MNAARTSRRGFTLIELLIVVGIIAILVAVLALAIIPYLGRANERATRSIMNSVGPLIGGEKTVLSVAQMRRDAGPLASQISRDPKIASAQLIVFYFAPSQKVRDQATVYKGRNVEARVDPKEWAKFLMTDSGADDMPYLADAWGTPYWYEYDKTAITYILRSAGEDLKWDTDDDLGITDQVKNETQFWNDIKK